MCKLECICAVSVAAEYCQAIESDDIENDAQLDGMFEWGRSSVFCGVVGNPRVGTHGGRPANLPDSCDASAATDATGATDVADAVAAAGISLCNNQSSAAEVVSLTTSKKRKGSGDSSSQSLTKAPKASGRASRTK
jgi:hypothetical protein